MAKNPDKNCRKKDVVTNRSLSYKAPVYNLTFDSLTGFLTESGFFSARKSEPVSFDWLLDGGNKQNGADGLPTSTTSFAANLSQPTINSFSSSLLYACDFQRHGMVTNVNPGFDLTQLLPPNLPKPEELQVFPYSHDLDALTRHASFPSSGRNRRPRPG